MSRNIQNLVTDTQRTISQDDQLESGENSDNTSRQTQAFPATEDEIEENEFFSPTEETSATIPSLQDAFARVKDCFNKATGDSKEILGFVAALYHHVANPIAEPHTTTSTDRPQEEKREAREKIFPAGRRCLTRPNPRRTKSDLEAKVKRLQKVIREKNKLIQKLMMSRNDPRDDARQISKMKAPVMVVDEEDEAPIETEIPTQENSGGSESKGGKREACQTSGTREKPDQASDELLAQIKAVDPKATIESASLDAPGRTAESEWVKVKKQRPRKNRVLIIGPRLSIEDPPQPTQERQVYLELRNFLPQKIRSVRPMVSRAGYVVEINADNRKDAEEIATNINEWAKGVSSGPGSAEGYMGKIYKAVLARNDRNSVFVKGLKTRGRNDAKSVGKRLLPAAIHSRWVGNTKTLQIYLPSDQETTKAAQLSEHAGLSLKTTRYHSRCSL